MNVLSLHSLCPLYKREEYVLCNKVYCWQISCSAIHFLKICCLPYLCLAGLCQEQVISKLFPLIKFRFFKYPPLDLECHVQHLSVHYNAKYVSLLMSWTKDPEHFYNFFLKTVSKLPIGLSCLSVLFSLWFVSFIRIYGYKPL